MPFQTINQAQLYEVDHTQMSKINEELSFHSLQILEEAKSRKRPPYLSPLHSTVFSLQWLFSESSQTRIEENEPPKLAPKFPKDLRSPCQTVPKSVLMPIASGNSPWGTPPASGNAAGVSGTPRGTCSGRGCHSGRTLATLSRTVIQIAPCLPPDTDSIDFS